MERKRQDWSERRSDGGPHARVCAERWGSRVGCAALLRTQLSSPALLSVSLPLPLPLPRCLCDASLRLHTPVAVAGAPAGANSIFSSLYFRHTTKSNLATPPSLTAFLALTQRRLPTISPTSSSPCVLLQGWATHG